MIRNFGTQFQVEGIADCFGDRTLRSSQSVGSAAGRIWIQVCHDKFLGKALSIIMVRWPPRAPQKAPTGHADIRMSRSDGRVAQLLLFGEGALPSMGNDCFENGPVAQGQR